MWRSRSEAPSNYSVTAPDGSPLPVHRVLMSADRRTATLVTDSQEDVTYTLFVQSPQAVINFPGTSVGEVFLQSATAVSNTQVILVFSDTLAADSDDIVGRPGLYTINSPNLEILGADLSGDRRAVLLTTSSQEDLEYTVQTNDVRDSTNKDGLLDPTRSSAAFAGIAPRDTTPPQVLRADPTSSSSILVSFSESLSDDSASPPNFTVELVERGGVPVVVDPVLVIDAQLGRENTQVELSTDALELDGTYDVTAGPGVRDRARNSVDPAANFASFTFSGSGVDQDFIRLVSAASIANDTVLVQFSRPMADNAIEPVNYQIFEGTLSNASDDPSDGIPRLPVREATFTSPSRNVVSLRTAPQNEVRYTLKAINVTDITGGPLEPVIIDHFFFAADTARFTGTGPRCGFCFSSNLECATDDNCDNDAPCEPGGSRLRGHGLLRPARLRR